MRHAQKSASYKPALLKALVRVCARRPESHVPLDVLGREFTRLYWNQTVIYRLRQAASLNKESVAVKLVRTMAERYRVRNLDDLPAEARLRIDRQMAQLLPINVLSAFHASKPAAMTPLYAWQAGQTHITISEPVRAFIEENAVALELIANYYWAEFLENTNRLAPRIVQKVSRDAAQRKSLQKYLKILIGESDEACFYCGLIFDATTRPTVDHVIPWSFLLEDALWDLVLACGPCNSSKSDWLPARHLRDKLIDRNRTRGDYLKGQISFLIADGEIDRLYEAALSVEWPHFWTPH